MPTACRPFASRCLPSFALFAAALAPLTAQTVHRVGPGFAPTIQAAIDAAAPGDIVEVASGNWAGFACGKSLTITAAPQANVQIVTAGSLPFALPSNGRLYLAGLRVQANDVQFAGGIAAVERCTFATAQSLRVATAWLSLRECTVTASTTAAVTLQNAHLHAVASTFATAAGRSASGSEAAIALQQQSLLQCNACTLRGAWPLGAQPSPALDLLQLASNAQPAWLVDCNLIGGSNGAARGPALLAPANGPFVRLHRGSLDGAIVGEVDRGPILGDKAPRDLRRGVPFELVLWSEPGHLLAPYAGFDITGPVRIGPVEQPALGFVGTAILAFAIADAQGRASATLTVPNAPQLLHLPIWFRTVDMTPTPWQASAAWVALVQ